MLQYDEYIKIENCFSNINIIKIKQIFAEK